MTGVVGPYRRLCAAAGVAVLVIGLAGCGGSSSGADTASSAVEDCTGALALATASDPPSANTAPVSFACTCQTAKSVWSTFVASYQSMSLPEGKALAAAKARLSFLTISGGFLSTLQATDLSNFGGSKAETFEHALQAIPADLDRVTNDWSANAQRAAEFDFSGLQADENNLDALCAGPDVIGLLPH